MFCGFHLHLPSSSPISPISPPLCLVQFLHLLFVILVLFSSSLVFCPHWSPLPYLMISSLASSSQVSEATAKQKPKTEFCFGESLGKCKITVYAVKDSGIYFIGDAGDWNCVTRQLCLFTGSRFLFVSHQCSFPAVLPPSQRCGRHEGVGGRSKQSQQDHCEQQTSLNFF